MLTDNETTSTFPAERRPFFNVFDVFLQNHQDSLVSKNNKKTNDCEENVVFEENVNLYSFDNLPEPKNLFCTFSTKSCGLPAESYTQN